MRLLSVYVVILALVNAHGAKILGVFPYCAKSHSIMTNAIVKELLNRGHQVTINSVYINVLNYIVSHVFPGRCHSCPSTTTEHTELHSN